VFLADLAGVGADRAACAATIEARWDPALGDHPYFRVRLDATVPFKFQDPQIETSVRKRA
jgi:hypothetical protein